MNSSPSGINENISAFVNGKRLNDRHFELAEIGKTEAGGVNRQALTKEDAEASLLVIKWAEVLGASASMDSIGNIFITYQGYDPSLPVIMTGSHLDTQPTGGKFDGIYGVLAGLEVLEALSASGMQLACSVVLVIWMNEEGSRFSPATMGSGVYSGALDLNDMLDITDINQISVKDELIKRTISMNSVPSHTNKFPCKSYLEAHIEQGPVLEDAGAVIGAVTGIQGLRQYEVTVYGKSAHAGTTPRAKRKDALLSAFELISNTTSKIHDTEDQVRFTVGKFNIEQGTPNTVPSKVVFSIDLRHPLDEKLDEIETLLLYEANMLSTCSADVQYLIRSPITVFDNTLIETIETCAKKLDFNALRLPSGATHDAKSMAMTCPTAMIFIPCKGGESHIESEWAEPEHLWAGACVLADTIFKIGMEK